MASLVPICLRPSLGAQPADDLLIAPHQVRHLAELCNLFADLAARGGLKCHTDLVPPAERFFELLDAQLSQYCMLLRPRWQQGDMRQPLVIAAAEAAAAQVAAAERSTAERTDGEHAGERVELVIMSGWLEKQPTWATRLREGLEFKGEALIWSTQGHALHASAHHGVFRFLTGEALIWNTRHVILRPGRLLWAHDAQHTEEKELLLGADASVSLQSNGELRIENGEQLLVFRASAIHHRRAIGSTGTTGGGDAATIDIGAAAAAAAATTIRNWALALEADCAAQGGRASVGRPEESLLLHAVRRPPSVKELCLMLNNVDWGNVRVDEMARHLRKQLPGLASLPRVELPVSRTSCEGAAAELSLFVIRRIVYRTLLAHLSHAKEGRLDGLLSKANEALHAIAVTARAPWRLPLLLGLLGALATALDGSA